MARDQRKQYGSLSNILATVGVVGVLGLAGWVCYSFVSKPEAHNVTSPVVEQPLPPPVPVVPPLPQPVVPDAKSDAKGKERATAKAGCSPSCPPGMVCVSGYTKKNGTHVKAYCRHRRRKNLGSNVRLRVSAISVSRLRCPSQVDFTSGYQIND